MNRSSHELFSRAAFPFDDNSSLGGAHLLNQIEYFEEFSRRTDDAVEVGPAFDFRIDSLPGSDLLVQPKSGVQVHRHPTAKRAYMYPLFDGWVRRVRGGLKSDRALKTPE